MELSTAVPKEALMVKKMGMSLAVKLGKWLVVLLVGQREH